MNHYAGTEAMPCPMSTELPAAPSAIEVTDLRHFHRRIKAQEVDDRSHARSRCRACRHQSDARHPRGDRPLNAMRPVPRETGRENSRSPGPRAAIANVQRHTTQNHGHHTPAPSGVASARRVRHHCTITREPNSALQRSRALRLDSPAPGNIITDLGPQHESQPTYSHRLHPASRNRGPSFT